MRVLVTTLALIIGIALTAAVAWNAAEAHYQNCVRAAQMLPNENPLDTVVQRQLGHDDPHAAEVYERVQGCSRLP